MRHRRACALAALSTALGFGLIGSPPAGAATPSLTAAHVAVAATPTVVTGSGFAPAGTLTIGAGVSFALNDVVEIALDDADVAPNCSAVPSSRDFVAFTTGGGATVTTSGSLQVVYGFRSSDNCVAQSGGTVNDILTITVTQAGVGPIVVGNVRYAIGGGPTVAAVDSPATGPVRLLFSGSAVGTPFVLDSAEESNAWISPVQVSGGTPSRAVLVGGGPVPLSPLAIEEVTPDAITPLGLSDVCLDIDGNVSWGTTGITGSSGLAGDQFGGVVVEAGPSGAANTRLRFSINALSPTTRTTFVIEGLTLVPGTTVGVFRIHLTDCGSAPFGTREDGTVGATGATFDTIGYFSNPLTTVAGSGGGAPSTDRLTRLGGADRIATAIVVSQSSFPAADSAAAVVLARSDDFADALAGTPLAAARNAPMLLTPTVALDANVLTEINRVLPAGGTVHVLGGPAAISSTVDSALIAAGYNVVRYAGVDRYDTAVRIATQGLGNPANLFLVTGLDFADALAAGPAAARVGGAILLTQGVTLPAATSTYLATRLGVTRYAIGGPAAAAVDANEELVGVDRYDTAVRVAQRFFTSPTRIGLATGTTFADALSGGTHLARLSAPLLLTNPGALPSVTSTYLTSNAASISSGFVYGGTSAVSDAVLSAAQVAIGGPAA